MCGERGRNLRRRPLPLARDVYIIIENDSNDVRSDFCGKCPSPRRAWLLIGSTFVTNRMYPLCTNGSISSRIRRSPPFSTRVRRRIVPLEHGPRNHFARRLSRQHNSETRRDDCDTSSSSSRTETTCARATVLSDGTMNNNRFNIVI